MPNTIAPADIVTNYLACWNEADPEIRRRLVAATWAEQARSVDPIADVTGHDAIAAMMGATQQQFPGHRFELDGEIRDHHDALHWGWRMVTPDATTLLSGIDVATVADGRIALLVGFFNP